MDALKIEGRILKVMPAQSGTSKRTGNSWMSQEYVLQFHVWDGARNPNYFIFRVFGEDRIKQFAIKEGDDVRVHYYPDGHEHEGRWFGENDAHKVEILMRDGQPIAQPPTSPETPAPQQSPQLQGEGKDDDLPF